MLSLCSIGEREGRRQGVDESPTLGSGCVSMCTLVLVCSRGRG